MTSHDGFETLAIHAGQEPDPLTGAVVPPIYQVSTFKQDGVGGLRGGYEYSRSANPTRTALEQCLAALEAAPAALAFASGLAAEDALLRTACSPGDHVLIPDDAYGGTYRLFARVLAGWGLSHTVVDMSDLAAVKEQLAARPVKLIWAETPTNPLLNIADIRALAAAAHAAGALLVVDNTFASPYLQQPLTLGADVVVHSTTKYLGGHSDVVGGAVVPDRPGPGRADRLHPQRHRRRPRAVRRLADPARHQDAGRADGPALPQRRAGGADAGRAPGGSRGVLPGPAHPSRAQDRAGADAGVRRHGVVPAAGRRGSRGAGLRPDPAVHPGRVAGRRRVADRAPGPDDARLGGRLAAGGPGRPDQALGGHRGLRRPPRRPAPGPGAGLGTGDPCHSAARMGSERIRTRPRAIVTSAPVLSSSATAGRFAASKAAC